MSNALARDLQPGEEVIVLPGFLPEEIDNPEHRIFVVEKGDGMKQESASGSIYGHWYSDYKPDQIFGSQIDVAATMKHQRAHPKK